MPTSPDARFGATWPLGGEPLSQGDDVIAAAGALITAKAALYGQGTAAARPAAAAGNVGMVYFATDTGVSYFSTGTKWRVLGGYVGHLSFVAADFAPDGFIKCTGQAVTTADVELRDWLIARSNPYGSSGGNPLLPPTPGRALAGAGTGQFGAATRANGALWGAETHQQTIGELAPHFHALRSDTVSGGIPTEDASTIAGVNGHVRRAGPNSAQGDTESVGSGTAFSMAQPSIALTLLVQAR